MWLQSYYRRDKHNAFIGGGNEREKTAAITAKMRSLKINLCTINHIGDGDDDSAVEPVEYQLLLYF